jgi:hypothetical protein
MGLGSTPEAKNKTTYTPYLARKPTLYITDQEYRDHSLALTEA